MALETLCALAIAGSAVSLVCSLVVMLRSTPQRVRKAAYSAVEIAEQTQDGFRNVANRMISFQDEITRERQIASDELEEAERKRRQAAAKLSAAAKKTSDASDPQPTTMAEALGMFPPGDPRRLKILRAQKMAAGDGAA